MNLRDMISKIQLNAQQSGRVLVCLLLLLCLGIAAKAIGAFYRIHSIGADVAESMEFLGAQNDKSQGYFQAYGKDVEKLREKGIFCIPKKEPPPPQVAGILGDRVLLNNKWCKVGDEHAGAKILEIGSTEVTILWKEKEMKLAPLLAKQSDSPPQRQKPTRRKRENRPSVAEKTHEVKAEPEVAVKTEDDPLAWLEVEVSPEARDFLLKVFEIMPAEQLEEAKRDWAEWSEERKQEQLDEIQEMVDSGQAEMVLEEMMSELDS